MNLQQLEYIIAVNRERHFVRAAEKCSVTQATLSMMIKKLEEELGLKIFDRNRQPVVPTKEGAIIIERAKKITAEVSMLNDFAQELKGEITGELRLGIIPTLAPYLLPLFLKKFTLNFPHLKIIIRELITADIIKMLKNGELDIGLLATPLKDKHIEEFPLFYEDFFAYASKSEKLPGKKYLLAKDININHLWLLEEGHCMRGQLMKFCTLKKREEDHNSLQYEAGSIETLIHLVDNNDGITILPKLATLHLSRSQKHKLREFAPPRPVREISLATTLNFPRKKMLMHLKAEILSSLKSYAPMLHKGKKILEWD